MPQWLAWVSLIVGLFAALSHWFLEGGFWWNIWTNVFANVVTVGSSLGLAWLLFWRGGRHPLTKFFGPSKELSATIFIGNVRSQKPDSAAAGRSGSSGAEAGLQGVKEAAAAMSIQRLLASPFPLFTGQAGFLGSLGIVNSNVQISAPRSEDEVDFGTSTVICLGSSKHSPAARLLELRFGSMARVQECCNETDEWEIVLPDDSFRRKDRAFIHRWKYGERFFFYIAGRNEDGTVGAARYLVENWRDLQRRYKKGRPFCLVVEIKDDDPRTVRLVKHVELIQA
jgi:hypothetical protein